jgi:hypothetical protein
MKKTAGFMLQNVFENLGKLSGGLCKSIRSEHDCIITSNCRKIFKKYSLYAKTREFWHFLGFSVLISLLSKIRASAAGTNIRSEETYITVVKTIKPLYNFKAGEEK